MKAAAGSMLLVAALLVTGRDAMAERPCPPVVRVSGEPELARSVAALLRKRGLSVDGPSARTCGTLTAVLEGRGEQTRITIIDPDGQKVERVAEDLNAAATTIESWARRDVSAPLLAAREGPRSPPSPAPDRESPPPIELAAAGPARPIAIAGAGEVGLSSDGASWLGVRAEACVQIRLLCVGALVGYARDQESGGDSRLYDSHRSVLELMLGADLPLRMGRFSLSPGAAIGQASLGTERRSGEHEQVPASYLALRGHVGAGIQLVGPWSLRADLALGSAPFAPGTVTEISFSQDPPSDTGEPPPLAGLPRWQGWFGFGLVYGGI